MRFKPSVQGRGCFRDSNRDVNECQRLTYVLRKIGSRQCRFQFLHELGEPSGDGYF